MARMAQGDQSVHPSTLLLLLLQALSAAPVAFCSVAALTQESRAEMTSLT